MHLMEGLCPFLARPLPNGALMKQIHSCLFTFDFSVYITRDTFVLWVAILFLLKLACINTPFDYGAI